jgi:hypothetical protein
VYDSTSPSLAELDAALAEYKLNHPDYLEKDIHVIYVPNKNAQ